MYSLNKIAVLFILSLCCHFVWADHSHIIMSYWAYPNAKFLSNTEDQYDLSDPLPGSYDNEGHIVSNQVLEDKLNLVNVIAYAFLHVDKSGNNHFANTTIDLSKRDQDFCKAHQEICTDALGKTTPKLGNFTAFTALQNNSNSLKKVIAIGGAGDVGSFHHTIDHQDNFVRSAEAIIHYYHLSGIDLDLEINDLYTPEQAQKYAQLISKLRARLGDQAIISMTSEADSETMSSIGRKNWELISNNVNFISVMCYDFHTSSYAPYYTGYNSNLFNDHNEPTLKNYYHVSCDQSIKYLTYLGVPATKIVLGFPSYGLSYGGVPQNNHGLFQPFNPRLNPVFDEKGAGRVAYKTIVKLLHQGFKEHQSFYNNQVSGVWAYNPKTQQLLTYDNPALIKEKASYIQTQNLAGVMTWLIGYDVPVSSRYSLLSVLAENLS